MFLNKKCLKRHFSFLIVLLAGDQLKAEAFVGKKWQGNILPIKFFIFYSTLFYVIGWTAESRSFFAENEQKPVQNRIPSWIAGALKGG